MVLGVVGKRTESRLSEIQQKKLKNELRIFRN